MVKIRSKISTYLAVIIKVRLYPFGLKAFGLLIGLGVGLVSALKVPTEIGLLFDEGTLRCSVRIMGLCPKTPTREPNNKTAKNFNILKF